MYYLLAIGIILFVLVCFVKLQWGALLCILLLPLYLVRFKVFFVPTNALDVMIFILFLVWMKQFSINDQKFKNLRIENWKLIIILILMIVSSFLSALLNDNKLKSLSLLKSWLLAPIILFAVLIITFNIKKEYERILSVLAMSGVAVAAIGLVYKFLGIVTFDGRLQGIYNSPNYLAMYLSSCLLICIYKIVKNSKFQNPNSKQIQNSNFSIFKTVSNFEHLILRFVWYLDFEIWLLGFIFIVFVIYYTYSYAAWLALFISLIAFFLIYIRYLSCSKKLIFLIGVVFLISMIFLGSVQLKSQKLRDLFNFERSSFQSRLMIWRSSAIILKNNPFWGIGSSNFQDEYLYLAGNFDKPYLEWAVPHPHNIFLAFWLYCGLLGFIGFMFLLFLFFKKGLDLFKSNPLLGALLIAIMIYILVHGLVDTTYFKNDLAAVFWIIIALSIN